MNAVKDRLKKNKASEAIHLLVEARNKDQNNYDINYLLGVCYLVNGQYPNGVAAFKHLLTNSKPKKDVYLMLSVCFKKLEDYASAEGIVYTFLFSSTHASKSTPSTTRPTSTGVNCM